MIRLALALSLLAGAAEAHDWYPASCCSERDCAPLSADDYSTESGGYRIHETDELIPFGSERMSPDGSVHRCTYGATSRKTRHTGDGPCFWAPMMGAGL